MLSKTNTINGEISLNTIKLLESGGVIYRARDGVYNSLDIKDSFKIELSAQEILNETETEQFTPQERADLNLSKCLKRMKGGLK